jgi:hypothetical protein
MPMYKAVLVSDPSTLRLANNMTGVPVAGARFAG